MIGKCIGCAANINVCRLPGPDVSTTPACRPPDRRKRLRETWRSCSGIRAPPAPRRSARPPSVSASRWKTPSGFGRRHPRFREGIEGAARACGAVVGHGHSRGARARNHDRRSVAVRRTGIERWLRDVVSWDLCDHLCGKSVRHRTDAPSLVRRWIGSPKLYVRRAAFATIAELAVHDKSLDDDTFADFSACVEHADDPRPHARQAASWALRSIGKWDTANHDRALQAAAELLATDDDDQTLGRARCHARAREFDQGAPARDVCVSVKSERGAMQMRRAPRSAS